MSKRNADRPAYEVFASAGEGEKPTPKYNNFVSAGRTLDGVGEVKEREKPSDFENTAPVDNRPLYEILREKEAKKQEEWQKLHNPFQPPKAMDEDEVQFLEDTEKLVRSVSPGQKNHANAMIVLNFSPRTLSPTLLPHPSPSSFLKLCKPAEQEKNKKQRRRRNNLNGFEALETITSTPRQ